MTYYVVVENGAHGKYSAQILGWPDTKVQGASRQEVLTTVRQRLATRLAEVEIVPMDVEPSLEVDHPWMKFAGMFENEPMFDEVIEHIEAYRHELDADDQVP